MSLLTKRIIFTKTGLLLLVILFFLGCKKEKNKIGLDDPNRLPSNTYFTDTITIKSEVIQVNDAIATTNVSNGGATSFLMAGAYTDPDIGKVAVESYTQLRLSEQYVELPSVTADSGYLFLNYSYYYGDTLVPQTLNVYKLTDKIIAGTTYYSTSNGIAYGASIGSIVGFKASSNTSSVLKIKIADSFLQEILEASKNNASFIEEIPGIALIPGDNSSGAILRIDGGSASSYLKIYYDLYDDNVQRSYTLTMDNAARKFYRVTSDRSGTDLAPLSNTDTYDSISTSSINNKCYIQSLTSIRTRISFPYLANLKKAFPNMAIVDAYIMLGANSASQPEKYSPSSGLVLLRTEWNGAEWAIKKDALSNPYYVQPNDYSQSANSAVKITYPVEQTYTIPVRSYFQSLLLGQVPNNPVIISPALVYTEANRLVFNNNDISHTDRRLRFNVYFTALK